MSTRRTSLLLLISLALLTSACSTSTFVHEPSTTASKSGAAVAGALTSVGKSALKVAVIDASSSKTRLYLYSVEPGPYPLVINVKETEFKRTASGGDEDGIDNFVDPTQPDLQASVVPEIITPLLTDLTTTVTAMGETPADVEVNLLATAGMRVAEQKWASSHPTAIADFYDIIRTAITAAGFKAGDVRTSDGSAEEGVWSWTNVNDSLVGAFTTQTPPVGVVEVGGSSAQISYPTNAPLGSANVYEVSVNGHQDRVFSRTFLGLGIDDARKEMRKASTAPQACFANGFPSAQDVGETQAGYPKLTVDGAYNPTTCAADFAKVVTGHITAAGDPQVANSTGEFIGTDATFYATDYFGASMTPQTLAAATERACGAAPDQLAINFPAIATSENEQRQCATSNYINTLLYDPTAGLFHANPAAFTKAVTGRSASGSTALTWTRGYLLLKYVRTA